MTFEEWLASKNKNGEAIGDRLAELFAVNGGNLRVSGWGFVHYGEGSPYGRTGLDQDEALELKYLHGIVEGFAISEGEAHASEVFNQEIIARIEARIATMKAEAHGEQRS